MKLYTCNTAPQLHAVVSVKNLFSNLFAWTDYLKYYPTWVNGRVMYLHWYLKFFTCQIKVSVVFMLIIIFFYVGLPFGGRIYSWCFHFIFNLILTVFNESMEIFNICCLFNLLFVFFCCLYFSLFLIFLQSCNQNQRWEILNHLRWWFWKKTTKVWCHIYWFL